ncbi:MAG: hypothetical protein C4543_01815 [Ignavibacteriales bacterium]|jgi:hypothetical protein|nr:MAG: hypothetical protein C4543_01815 [Ignavibacteriales bacterium]
MMDVYFNEINVLQSIIDADHDDKFVLYHNYFDVIKDYAITFVDDKVGKNNYKYMLDILQIDSQYIFSPFHSHKLYTLNEEFVSSLSPMLYFFDISLDTNIVSYIDRFQRGTYLDGKPLEMVKSLGKHRQIASTINLSPYLNENCLFEGQINSQYKATIYNFFYYLNKFHHRWGFIAKRKSKKSTEMIIKNQELLLNSPLADIFKQQFKIIYSSVLMIALLNLSNLNKKDKIIKLIDFMANDIKAMDICLLEIAAVYFVKKHNLTFFGKLQKGMKDIVDIIRNLSWDIFHLRYQEFLLSVKPVKGIDVNLVLFCTLDKRLTEIQEIIKLKAIAYNTKTGNYYPFYQNESVLKMLSKEEVHKYFQPEKHFDRISTKLNINYDNVISNLEKTVITSYSKSHEGADKS